MDILQILKIVAALATVATGLISLVKPRAIKGFTGLEATGPRGITEIRAVLGGLFIGLGLAPFILAVPQVYQMLGIAYLAIGAVRAVSMVLDRSVVQSNVISLAVEIVFGVILVL
ncbi:MAG: DUF4345 family protein [Anaerolineales bacterium]|nr:DUF4345 family protein [Anaerolineales bacterium]